MDPRIQIALRIIEEHRGDSKFLQVASGLLGLSPARLHRLFKQTLGKTLGAYLRELKMTQAAQMLDQYDLPIKEIAYCCGYSDLSNFYRDFKRVHSLTPQQFRLVRIDLLNQSAESVPLAKGLDRQKIGARVDRLNPAARPASPVEVPKRTGQQRPA